MKSLWKIKKWSSAVFQSIGKVPGNKIEQGVVMEYEERENEKEDYRTDPAFFARAVVGMMLIFIINQWVLPADSSINVGLNPVSF